MDMLTRVQKATAQSVNMQKFFCLIKYVVHRSNED